ncbi:MAG: YfhO family protein [Lachnospiraceae bacterium]|nr:YfhO family protein [Lachnospiraceae bacterium]
MRKFVREHNRICEAAAFCIPFLICVCICIANGVYPFGENCILNMDMYHQYCPFFTEFMDKLKNGGSMQYSFRLGLGSDFVSLYAYYLSSPLNLLLVFCPQNLVIEFMTLMILLKIGLCGLFFFQFLKYHYRMEGKDGRMHDNLVLPALVFSTAYALSGFVAAYSWDIMWMDSVALFPLVVVGLERLVKEQKPGLYFVTLALSIFSNYYISIMICIFLVFDFALLFVQNKGKRIGAFLRFSWYSLLAGASSAVLLFPEIKLLSVSGSAGDSFPKAAEWYFPVVAEFSRMAVTADGYMGNDHWPNLYAGAFTLVLIWLYMLNRRISMKEKIPRLLLAVFFLISFAQNQLDFIWHGMHFPQGLPGRQSFLFIFLLLSIGFATVRKWKGTKGWHILLAGAAAVLLLLFGAAETDEAVTGTASTVITVLFLLVYVLLMLLLKLVRVPAYRQFLTGFILCTAVGELVINMAVTGLEVTSRTFYRDKTEAYETLMELADRDNEENGGGFYRIEDTGRKTKNDDALYGYPSATIFSSLMNLDVSHLYQSLYMEGGKNFYCYNGATPLSSAMFSVRYMLSDNACEESELRTLVGSCDGNYLYRNNYCLPLGWMIDEEAILGWRDSRSDRIDSLNSLAISLGAEGELLYPALCTVTNQVEDTRIDIVEDGYYYAAYPSCSSDRLTVTRQDGWKQKYAKTSHRYLLNLGECKAGDEIHITGQDTETVDFTVYRLNMRTFEEAYEALKETVLKPDIVTDRRVEGTVSVKAPGRLVISIPADEGWSLLVDGKKIKIQPFKDALMAVHLEEGEHRIALTYTTPGLYAGTMVSAAALALAGISLSVGKLRKKRKSHG